MKRRKTLTELSDADHAEILDNPAADAAIAEQAMKRAVASGMSREDAERLYGLRRSDDR